MKDPIRKVEFIPRFSVFTKTVKTIAFEIANNFDFSSIKNIVTLKFVTPKVKTVIKLFAGIAPNKIKFKQIAANAVSQIFISAYTSFRLNAYGKPIIKLFTSSKKNALNFVNIASARIKIFAQIKAHIKFNAICNESFELVARSVSKIKFLNSASARLKVFAGFLSNKLKFASESDARVDLFAKSKEDLNLKTDAAAKAILNAESLENELNFKTSASAIAYRPMMMKSIYDVKMEDLYYKTMEEVFYGQTLE